jgi:hypothetical protein
MMLSRLIGLFVVVTFIPFGVTGFQSIMATIQDAAVIEVTEAAEAGNATMVRNATGNMTEVEFLSIQTAQSGSISEINATDYTLNLNNVSDSTILFSDRPERIVESVSTADFVGNWTNAPDSFAADAPNAALIIEEIQTGELDSDVIELFNPVYDSNANSLTYTIMREINIH